MPSEPIPPSVQVIGVAIALDAITEISNHTLFQLLTTSHQGECEVRFQNGPPFELFLARAHDFVSGQGSAQFLGKQMSLPDFLIKVADHSVFNTDAVQLKDDVTTLREWLDKERKIKLWLPSLDRDVSLATTQAFLLSVAGNQSKHNISQLTRVCEKIHKELAKNGYEVPFELIPFALDDFRQHLIEDHFVYHASWLAELINNVAWSLHDHLVPLYRKTFSCNTSENASLPTYQYPAGIETPITQTWYRWLMNLVRCEPYHRRFRALYLLKGLSGLERLAASETHAGEH